MKFAIGQRVRITKLYPDYAFRGVTGTVTGVDETSTYPYMMSLDETVRNFQLGFDYLQHVKEEELEAIDEK
ncbi:hypothetical protein [Caulobacter phage Cr30]|uniref:hypothetical protein n=1 Tax=Caulobacter phage Cr30 TaxID=1357714 RepID=UPI0004A9B8F0|nr:hypothetical protein OZ74_gp169 [Caulobacter phage Cr30]AGS81054.1 hypothetical protein [Caulobacter phage Cr30]